MSVYPNIRTSVISYIQTALMHYHIVVVSVYNRATGKVKEIKLVHSFAMHSERLQFITSMLSDACMCIRQASHHLQYADYSTLNITHIITIFMELTAQKGKGDRGKRTSDRAQTQDLHSIAEFQPREPWRLVELLHPPSLLCTGHRCATTQRHFTLLSCEFHEYGYN